MTDTNSLPSDQTPEKSKPARRLFFMLPVVVFTALATIFLMRILTGGDISQVPSVLIDKPVPEFELPALAGLSNANVQVPGMSTNDLTGKITLVNVFASWCGPCRQEHPLLMDLAKRQDLQIFGVNQKDQPANALRFLEELGNPYTRVGVDQRGRASIEWGVYGVPETFVVDPTGCIRAKVIGPLTPQSVTEVINPMVTAVLTEATPPETCTQASTG